MTTHPFSPKFKRIEFRRLETKKLISLSLDGIEVVNYYTGKIARKFLEFVQEEKDFVEVIRQELTIPIIGRINFFKARLNLLWYNTVARKRIAFG